MDLKSTGGSVITYLRTIIGTYTPTDPTSMAGADWEYIISGLIVLLFIYFFLKLFTLIFKSV